VRFRRVSPFLHAEENRAVGFVTGRASVLCVARVRARSDAGSLMAPRTLAPPGSSRTVLYAAIAGNILVALTKFVAAFMTGSSAMLSEAVHSLVDTGNEALLLYGLHRAGARPDLQHPLGHGRELYFWSFVVALLVFVVGAVISMLEGVFHILRPHPIANPIVNYIVLGLSVLFDGSTWWIALHAFKGAKPYADVFGAIRQSKDPPSFIVIFEDSAALIGLVVAFLGSYLSVRLHMPVLDGVASIVIGVVLAITATLLARETKGLLIGEPADPSIVQSITRIAEEMEGVAHANGVLTVHLGPRQVVVALSLEFDDALATPQIEAKVRDLERLVRRAHPEVIAVFVKPQSAAGYMEAMEERARILAP
jgi:cation diffusion facilitator family transporter